MLSWFPSPGWDWVTDVQYYHCIVTVITFLKTSRVAFPKTTWFSFLLNTIKCKIISCVSKIDNKGGWTVVKLWPVTSTRWIRQSGNDWFGLRTQSLHQRIGIPMVCTEAKQNKKEDLEISSSPKVSMPEQRCCTRCVVPPWNYLSCCWETSVCDRSLALSLNVNISHQLKRRVIF